MFMYIEDMCQSSTICFRELFFASVSFECSVFKRDHNLRKCHCFNMKIDKRLRKTVENFGAS